MNEQRFTFTFSSSAPRRHVRCALCGWQATSEDKSVFDEAEEHACPTNDRDVMDVFRSDEAMAAFGVERRKEPS